MVLNNNSQAIGLSINSASHVETRPSLYRESSKRIAFQYWFLLLIFQKIDLVWHKI